MFLENLFEKGKNEQTCVIFSLVLCVLVVVLLRQQSAGWVMNFKKKAGLFVEKVYLYRLKFHVYKQWPLELKRLATKKN